MSKLLNDFVQIQMPMSFPGIHLVLVSAEGIWTPIIFKSTLASFCVELEYY